MGVVLTTAIGGNEGKLSVVFLQLLLSDITYRKHRTRRPGWGETFFIGWIWIGFAAKI